MIIEEHIFPNMNTLRMDGNLWIKTLSTKGLSKVSIEMFKHTGE